MNHGAIFSSDAFRSMRTVALMGTTLPSHAFFTPEEPFWQMMTAYAIKHGIEIVDCGCGIGLTVKEAEVRGIPLRGVDLAKRHGQHPKVEQLDATMLSWNAKKWPLICRPDGSGWCHDVILNARQQGASTIYVGVSRNYERDLSMFRTTRLPGVYGEEGERAWIIRPLKGGRK